MRREGEKVMKKGPIFSSMLMQSLPTKVKISISRNLKQITPF